MDLHFVTAGFMFYLVALSMFLYVQSEIGTIFFFISIILMIGGIFVKPQKNK